MDKNLNKIFHESFPKETPPLCYNYCEGTWLPEDYLDIKESVDNFEIRDDDIWMCSFPKTGATWTQEMVWCIANDLDFEGAKQCLQTRFPGLESTHAYRTSCASRRRNLPVRAMSVQQLQQLPSPRFIKSHLPYHLLPKQLTEGKTSAKIIYITRNSKDACISGFHFYRHTQLYQGTYETFCNLFLGDTIPFGPFWKHVTGFWEHKNSKNIHFLKYEDMKKDLRSVIRNTASFLNKVLTEEQVRLLEDHLSFENMKSNPCVNYEREVEALKILRPLSGHEVFKFMRKGEVQQWKSEMSDDLIERFKNWTNKHLDKYPEMKHEFS